MKNVNVDEKDWTPNNEYIQNIKERIDTILDNNSLGKYPVYEGAGRTVLIIDKVAVKIPEYHDKLNLHGNSQNIKELEVYLKSKHHRLTPIYTTHRGCIITKAIIADMHTLEDDLKLSWDFIKSEIDKGVEDLKDIVDEFGLDPEDIKAPRNWGYDVENKKFLCVDYGY